MSGRISALWNIVLTIPSVAGGLAAGWIAERLTPGQTFELMAALAALLAAFALWKPFAVFNHTYGRPQAMSSDLVGDIKRLFRHRGI